MAEIKSKMHLPKLDDLFTTEEERYDSSLERIENININEIDNFPDHPFKVIENDELITVSFKVTGTKEQIKKIKELIIELGVEYE